MARTFVGVNSPQAVKRWSGLSQVAAFKKSYFASKFMGKGKMSYTPIQRLTDLESDRADTITVDLLMPKKMEPVIGDATLDGQEEGLRYYTDRVVIEQVRGGSDAGSTMTRKRTVREIREDVMRAESDWWARLFDELFMVYMAGARGVDTGYVISAGNPLFTVNALTAPDAQHQLYGGTATSAATITNTMNMDYALIDRAKVKADVMGGDATDEISMVPCKVGSNEERYVCVMHPFQFYAMKTSTATGNWLDIQKAAAAAEGENAMIFKGGLGEYNGVVLHSHRNVVGFNNYGASSNLPARRALFMGAQAAVIAFGSPGNGLHFDWTEEVKDHGDKLKIGTKSIFGIKKSTYTSQETGAVRDFGVMALDTHAANPNP